MKTDKVVQMASELIALIVKDELAKRFGVDSDTVGWHEMEKVKDKLIDAINDSDNL